MAHEKRGFRPAGLSSTFMPYKKVRIFRGEAIISAAHKTEVRNEGNVRRDRRSTLRYRTGIRRRGIIIANYRDIRRVDFPASKNEIRDMHLLLLHYGLKNIFVTIYTARYPSVGSFYLGNVNFLPSSLLSRVSSFVSCLDET